MCLQKIQIMSNTDTINDLTHNDVYKTYSDSHFEHKYDIRVSFNTEMA